MPSTPSSTIPSINIRSSPTTVPTHVHPTAQSNYQASNPPQTTTSSNDPVIQQLIQTTANVSTLLTHIVHSSNQQNTTSKINAINNKTFPKLKNKSSFNKWFEKIISILAGSEWNAVFYDTINRPFKTTTADNRIESTVLYTKLKQCLEGDMENAFMGTEDLYMQRGLELLEAIKVECHPKYNSNMLLQQILAIARPTMNLSHHYIIQLIFIIDKI